MRELLPSILESVSIPVIAAGNVVDGRDIHEVLAMGAAGVQMGARFAATLESSADPAFKQMYVDATAEDMVLIQSPVGLPGRALRNELTDRLLSGTEVRTEPCVACLKKCGKQFCIMNKLISAHAGDVEQGLVFTGGGVERINDIPAVAVLMDRLEREYEATADEELA
jgi:NAD(P)H-dependent flavin oxidoreductase YrpB (nitropropane dioxygenase family)